jgi:hypothetical protein
MQCANKIRHVRYFVWKRRCSCKVLLPFILGILKGWKRSLHQRSMAQDRKKIFKGNWNDILAVSYIVETRKRTSVIWLGKPIIILDQYALPRGYYEPFPIDILTNIFNITRTQTHANVLFLHLMIGLILFQTLAILLIVKMVRIGLT